MKKLLIFVLLALAVPAMCGCSLFARDRLVNEQSLPLNGVNDIQIDYGEGHVTILPASGNQLEIKEHMSLLREDYDAVIVQDGPVLTVIGGKRPPDPAFSAKISIYLPSAYAGSLDIQTAGGSITSQATLALRAFTAVSESGGIDCSNLTAPSIKLINNSGGIDGQSLNGVLDVVSQSGSTRLQDVTGSGTFSGGSGRMEVSFEQLTDSLSMSTTSGRLDLILPEDTEANFLASTTGGALEVSLPGELETGETTVRGMLGSTPRMDINLSTTSGRLYVRN